MLDSDVIHVAFISVLNAKHDSVLKKAALSKQGGPFLLHFYNLWILFLTFAFSTFPPLSTNLSKKKKKNFKVQVVHSYCYTISSLSGREYYNQHHNVNSFSLNMFHIHVFQNHNVDWEKKPTNESDVIIHFLLCCVSFPSLLPFPCKEL